GDFPRARDRGRTARARGAGERALPRRRFAAIVSVRTLETERMSSNSGTFMGYARPDGSVGIRNVIAVISVMDNCNPVSRAVASAVHGTIYLPVSFIRGQLAKDREITLRVTAGLCLNPNVAGVVVIGLEPRTTAE